MDGWMDGWVDMKTNLGFDKFTCVGRDGKKEGLGDGVGCVSKP
jgi:hypothetical protein